MSTTPPPADVATLAQQLLREGQSTTQVRAVLREQHGLSGYEAGRILKRVRMEMETPPEAVAVAEEQLRQGHSRHEVQAAIAQRFGLGGAICRKVVDAAVAELIGDFELGEVDRWLEEAMINAGTRSLSAAEPPRRRWRSRKTGRAQGEEHLERVWAAYDALTDADGTPRETINAAKQLDQLLGLGWRRRLPKGSFE
jgi:hypothetical protein